MRRWVDRYIGMRFLDKGRDARGVDCWGLIRLIYRQELGIDLPTYAEISSEDLLKVANEITLGKDGEAWQSVEPDAIEEFDVCVMRYLGMRQTGHVGIVTHQKRILHIETGIDASQVPLNDYSIRNRIRCFRRHKSRIKF